MLPETNTAIRTGMPVGAYLRDMRESQGLQLDDVAKVTRISKNYLVAIEDGMFEKLPNAAYVKGFLRLYAGVLGLSGDEIIAMYDSSAASVTPLTPLSAERPQSKRVETIKSGGRNRWILPLLLLSLVLMAAFFLQEKDEKRGTRPPPTSSKPQVAVLPSPLQPVHSSAKVSSEKAVEAAAPAVNPASNELIAGEPRPKGVFLKLKFNQDSSLNVTIDDSISQHYELKSGDLIEWKAEKSFTLDLGNAGGVEAEFNGKPLKPFGAAGVPAHVVLKADVKE